MADEKVKKTLDTPHGTIEWKELGGQDPQKAIALIIRELAPEELKSLNEDADRVARLIDKYVPLTKRDTDLLENLDLAFAAWLESDDSSKESAKDITRIVGAAYGRYCIERLGVRWAVIQDEHGIDIALVRENPTTRSFPFTSIQYRVEDKKSDFIYALYRSLKHIIDDAK